MSQSKFSRLNTRKLFYGVILLLTAQITVAEPVHAEKIISVDSNATEILLALDIGSKIIATDITSVALPLGRKSACRTVLKNRIESKSFWKNSAIGEKVCGIKGSI